MTIRPILALSLLTLVGGCDWIVGPAEGERVGVISFYDEPLVVSLPDTVAAGVPFEVSVLTYGGGCVRQGGTDVTAAAGTHHITPYDVHTGADTCTSILNIFEHAVSVTFDDPGAGLIRIHGRQEPEGRPFTVERQVVVR